MRKRLGDFLPLILVGIGLCILLYPTVSNFLVERNSSRVIENYDAAVENLTEEKYAQMLGEARAYNEHLAQMAGAAPQDEASDSAAPINAAVPAEGLPAYDDLLNLNGDGVMGYLTIPKLDVTMPVYHTVEEPVLQVGAGHLPDTSLPVGGPSTHAVLSGHRGLPRATSSTSACSTRRAPTRWTASKPCCRTRPKAWSSARAKTCARWSPARLTA